MILTGQRVSEGLEREEFGTCSVWRGGGIVWYGTVVLYGVHTMHTSPPNDSR